MFVGGGVLETTVAFGVPILMNSASPAITSPSSNSTSAGRTSELMTDKKIITVVGATGSQGGGLARAILADPQGPFAVRALTRDPGGAKAMELAAQGAEVVHADLDDVAAVRTAFEGAYGAFVVTNYWAARTPKEEAARSRAQMERDQADTAAQAAKDAGLKHVVWSTLEDTRPHFAHLGINAPVLAEGYTVPHFDAKAEANASFTRRGIPTTFLETTAYYEAFLMGAGPHRGENGELAITNPMGDSVISFVWSEDIGRTAYGIFLAGPRFIGRTVSLASTHATGKELAGLFTKALGEKVVYRPVSNDQLRASGAPGIDEVANNWLFYAEAHESFVSARDLDLIRKINPQLKPLEEWLTEHKNEIPLG
jgi:uncharacterized protein YbjT (DUF2867 family)